MGICATASGTKDIYCVRNPAVRGHAENRLA